MQYILITRGHIDHIGVLEEVQSSNGAPAGIRTKNAQALKQAPNFSLEDGQRLMFGNEELKVFHAPGHSPGGGCFLAGKILFRGDTLFPNGPGNTLVTGANHKVILQSIHHKNISLPDDARIYPRYGLETFEGQGKKTSFYPLPRNARKP